MKAKRSKANKKTMAVYNSVFKFREPYQVLCSLVHFIQLRISMDSWRCLCNLASRRWFRCHRGYSEDGSLQSFSRRSRWCCQTKLVFIRRLILYHTQLSFILNVPLFVDSDHTVFHFASGEPGIWWKPGGPGSGGPCAKYLRAKEV